MLLFFTFIATYCQNRQIYKSSCLCRVSSFDIEFVDNSTIAHGYRITRAGSTNIDASGGYVSVFLFSALTNTANNWKYLAASSDLSDANNSLWVASASATTCTVTLRAINKSFSFNFKTNKVTNI